MIPSVAACFYHARHCLRKSYFELKTRLNCSFEIASFRSARPKSGGQSKSRPKILFFGKPHAADFGSSGESIKNLSDSDLVQPSRPANIPATHIFLDLL